MGPGQQSSALYTSLPDNEGFEQAFVQAPVGLAINDQDGRFVEVNAHALALFGLCRDEMLGHTSHELGLLPPHDRLHEQLAAAVAAAESVRDQRWTMHSRDGEVRELTLLISPLEFRGRPCHLSAFVDVTEHERTRERLTLSERHYRRIVETSREGICITDANRRFTFVNARMADMFGYRVEELLGRSPLILADEQVQPELTRLMERRRQGIGEGGEMRFKHRDGSDLWVWYESSPFQDPPGNFAGAMSMLLDITDRKRAEERLRQSEAQLAEAQALAHIGSWEWDLRTDRASRSDELCRIFGLTHDQFRSTPSYERVHPEDRDRVRETIDSAARDGEPWSVEYRVLRPDGVRVVHARGQVARNEAGRPIRMFGTIQDITERRAVEARLVLSDRMASLGTLASGVGHEINNPLATVISNLDLLSEEIQVQEAVLEPRQLRVLEDLAHEARQGADRVRRIVRDLMTFARVRSDQKAPLDVRLALDLAINLTFPEIRYRARLVKDYAATPVVDADEAELGQLFVNLLLNAAHAIPEGQASVNEIRLSTRTDPAGWALVEVHDTGPGLMPEVLDHVFEPFYVSASNVGWAGGLALSICHRIVAGLEGVITVESQPGKGSTFRVALPPGRLAPSPPHEASPSPAEPSGRGRILVIDDEPLVGGVIARLLRDHIVTVVTSAREGLARISAGESFDVILCDLMMPEMTGMDFHAQLGRVDPALLERLVFMTGGAFSPTAQAFLERIPNERLEKPFQAQNLRALVQRYLRWQSAVPGLSGDPPAVG